MPARRLALAALALAAALSACDSNGASAVTGVWEGTARFEADTLLPDHNVRVKADYEMTFRFELVEDDGLVTGQITRTAAGQRIVREATPGFPADTAVFDGATPLTHDLFGTFLVPELEVDVPDGPYEEDLWTFDVSGGRAVTDKYIVSLNTITLRDGTTFEVDLRSDETFTMRRIADDAPPARPAAPAGGRPAAIPPARLAR
jgi:hypothetical protein